ncbi:MAG: FG-GAP-like repeat-containing protein, partial [Schlesneria sp.]
MPKHSWIRHLFHSLSVKPYSKSRRRRSRQSIEALEARMLLTTPTVVSLNLVGAAITNSTSTSWTATFSESVSGVDPTDFALVETGTVGATLTQVTPVSGSIYTVTVKGITGNGTLGLNLIDNDSITNSTNIPLGGTGRGNGNFIGQVATLDHASPFVQSINRTTPASATTSASSVSFTATFSEPVTGVTSKSFSLVETGTVGATTTLVTPVSTSVYTITVSGIGGNGNLGLNLTDDNSIRDLAGNTLISQSAVTSFATQATFATGTGPISVKSGDFNGDGNIDLVIANRGSSSVSVLLGNGNGTFKAQQTFATGATPYSVSVADANGDGKSDLIVTNRNGNSVSVLLGNGNGTFQTQHTFSVGTAPTSITAGDVNGDGKIDLLVANETSNNISLLLGNGDGTFQAQQTFATGNLPQSIKMADVNGDGKPDLFVTNRNGNSVSVLMGNGNGTFQPQQTISTGTATPYSLALSDFNGDGKPDLVVATSAQGGAIDLFLGNGNGTFGTGKTFATSSSPQSVAIGDVNGDGLPDVFVSSFSKSSVSVLSGNGNGTFQPQQTFATGNGPYSQSVAPVDLNGDGRLDVAVANLSDNTVSVLLANGNGNFTGQVYTLVDQVSPSVLSINRATPTTSTTNLTAVSYTVTFSEAVTGVDAADFSLAPTGTVAATTPVVTTVSPSVYTVAVGGITGIGSLGLNLVDNNSIHDVAGHPLTTPGAAASFAGQATFATGTQPKSVSLTDVNGDGKPDLVVANFNSNSVSIMLGNGNGTFQAQQTFATGSNPVSVASGDVDGDGRVDLIVANKGSNSVSVLLGNGNGIFRPQQTFATGTSPFSVTLGDVSGDGYSDVIVANYGSSTVGVLLGNGNGTFQAQRTFATGSNPRSVISTDLNGDGKLDIVVANYTNSGSVSVLLGNGNGTFQVQQTFATGSFPTSIAAGDLNGDGKPDLAVANRGGSTLSVLLGNGNGTFQAQQTVSIGTSPFSVVIADVNGDGSLDFSVANYSNNSVSVLLGNGDGTFQTQQTFATGSFPISITLGDVSSDGRPDLLVANSSGNTVSVLLGNLNGNFTGQIFTIATVPALTTPTSASITATTATLGGNVSSDGGSPITERGIAYSLTSVNPNPRIGGTGVTKLTATGTTGVFTVNASSLSSGVSYSFAAYGTTAIGTTYTSPVSTFTTLSTPIVTSPTSSNTTGTTAVLGGNVTSDGGSPVTERGVVYSLSNINPNPHIGGAGVTKVTASGSTGIFTVNVSSLTSGSGYSYAAYATNSFGTTYTSPIATFVPGLLIVNGVYSSSGQPINSGNTLTSPVTSVSVTFSAAMNTVTGGTNSVTNPANWVLTRYGIDVSNEISGITFAATTGSLNDVAVISFSQPLVQGGYQLTARQSLYDAT